MVNFSRRLSQFLRVSLDSLEVAVDLILNHHFTGANDICCGNFLKLHQRVSYYLF